MQKTEEIRDRVVLVGLSSPVLKKEENADEGTMEELAALVETAGAETIGTVLQNRPSRTPARSSARARWRKCGISAGPTAPPW